MALIIKGITNFSWIHSDGQEKGKDFNGGGIRNQLV